MITSPKMQEHTPSPTPSRAVYGFAMFLSFKLFFIFYIIWAYVPESWFEEVGITYLPNRYWSVSVPLFLLTVFLFAFIIYPSLGLLITPNIDELKTICDQKSKYLPDSNSCGMNSQEIGFCCCNSNKMCKKTDFFKSRQHSPSECIPVLCDLNITDVSEHLYLK